jgi:hypothetical protein
MGVYVTHVLNQLAHAGLCDGSSTKYLRCVFCGSTPCVRDISATQKNAVTVLHAGSEKERGLLLEESNRSSNILRLLAV